MIKNLQFIFCALGLLTTVACDTVEDSFVVGNAPKEDEFLNVDQSQVTFSPEGASYDISITSIAAWEVSISGNNSGQFSVTPSYGKGNGTVTVTAKSNPSSVNHTAELQIRPLNLDMDPVRIELRQINTTFSIETFPASDVLPEEGGVLTMTAYSSVDWVLEPVAHDADGTIGDMDWITVTPGLAGEGNAGNLPCDFRFVCDPNLSKQERTVRLQLKPASGVALTDLPRPFSITQAAGTEPQSLRCTVDRLDIVNANVTLEYSSRSAVKDCGVYVYKGNNLEKTIRPQATDGSFAKTGSYKIVVAELDENTDYQLIPFCENEVGKSNGDAREVKTGIKPENMVYEGVVIVDGKDGVNITSDYTSAVFTLTVTSDVEPLNPRIASAVLTVDGKNINGTPTEISAGSWQYVFNTANIGELVSNKEYSYSIVITSSELPRSQGQMLHPTANVSGTFKTKGKTPADNDNNIPTIGNKPSR